MANLIERAAKAIRRRLAELVGEQRQLQKALAALERLLGSERGRAAEARTGAGTMIDRRWAAPPSLGIERRWRAMVRP